MHRYVQFSDVLPSSRTGSAGKIRIGAKCAKHLLTDFKAIPREKKENLVSVTDFRNITGLY